MVESVAIKYGHYFVEPKRIKKLKIQELNSAEIHRIVVNREEWLNWVNDHFAAKCIVAPEKYK